MYNNIRRLLKEGRIRAYGEAEDELLAEETAEEELSPAEQQFVDSGDSEAIEDTPESIMGDETLPHEETAEELGVANTPTEEETTTDVKKKYTLEILSKIVNHYDLQMKELEIDWNAIINKGSIKKGGSFIYVEDLHTLLNNTFDDKQFAFVKIYNDLYDYLTDSKNSALLSLYSRESYGKPFIGEGLALLLFELTFDWSILLTRYYKEMPDVKDEQDSFFAKFPNLRFLTYIAHLIINAKDLKDLISKDAIRDLLTDENSYRLADDGSVKGKKQNKTLYKLAGENFSYYASLIKNNYADIMVGTLSNLSIISFLSKKTAMDFPHRCSLIKQLITAISSKTPINTDASGNVITSLDMADVHATELLKNRSEAKILFDSNEKNFPLAAVGYQA